MRNRWNILVVMVLAVAASACSRNASGDVSNSIFTVDGWNVNGTVSQSENIGVNTNPVIRFRFSAPVDRSSVPVNIQLVNTGGTSLALNSSFESADSVVVLRPATALAALTNYTVNLSTQVKSIKGALLKNSVQVKLFTGIDSSNKFPVISDDSLLTLVQKQTFAYFWDLAHPVSGLARERNSSGDIVTSGGSGFGMMATIVAIQRGFISKAQGLARLKTSVTFLKNTAQKFHGAFPHWLNGGTGAVVPFSAKDDGADLVETSYLIAGLLTVRQYFNSADTEESNLRNDINTIVNGVEWSWFRKGSENVLYWHWSPNFGWDMNLPIRGWNECLISYVLAASSTTFPISKTVYDNGWAKNGAIKTNGNYLGITLPLGEPFGGPLFFSHYSFLGLKPAGLSDQYADYHTQVINHSRINYEYCKANPKGFFGYSSKCWGLTASDIPGGYTASSPTNDVGVIAPTAALSSMPYTPTESMAALKFFYYTLGDKIWKPYGFVDAFSLKTPWFADSFLAIDQGPIIIMIENYRTGLIWNLFTSCSEVKAGLTTLGFSAPYL